MLSDVYRLRHSWLMLGVPQLFGGVWMLLTLETLAVLSQLDLEDVEEDPLAQLTIDRATVVVHHHARRFTSDVQWDVTDPERHPPQIIATVAESLAQRTYNNPFVLETRRVGPLTDTFVHDVLTGMALTPEEQQLVAQFAPDAEENEGGRLWAAPLYGREGERVELIPYERAYMGVQHYGPRPFIKPWGYR